MAESGYEYRDLLATTWDLFRGDTSDWPDRPFYRAAITESGQPALDVGCATGRLILDYLAQGIDIDGVDVSPEMLAICRQKAEEQGLEPNLYQQAMEHLSLPRRYRTIIVSSSTFQLITDRASASEVMDRIFEHLLPGGSLVMSFMILGKEEQGNQTANDWQLLVEKIRPEDSAMFRRWGRARFDYKEQLEHTEDRYEMWLDDVMVKEEVHIRSPATRWYTLDQAKEIYRSAGFSNIRAVKEFTSEPIDEDEPLFCIFGSKP